MTTLFEPTTSSFIKSFDSTHGHVRPWVNALRKRGIDTFQRLGIPTTAQEEWRDTNISPIANTSFVPAAGTGSSGQAAIDLAQRLHLRR